MTQIDGDRVVNSWYTFHRGKVCLPIDSIDKVADEDTERAIAPFVVSALALPHLLLVSLIA
ncbi:hypothetical protein [Coleofasciculus chthonoplastes]|uniref:hypothetical protein n=1 Tax=Coleofasciculus chthonoplastes TaxID=64178 RepID=UPI0005C76B26|nr:hypothetical protein [Coleofasciculus chthonoplastes]